MAIVSRSRFISVRWDDAARTPLTNSLFPLRSNDEAEQRAVDRCNHRIPFESRKRRASVSPKVINKWTECNKNSLWFGCIWYAFSLRIIFYVFFPFFAPLFSLLHMKSLGAKKEPEMKRKSRVTLINLWLWHEYSNCVCVPRQAAHTDSLAVTTTATNELKQKKSIRESRKTNCCHKTGSSNGIFILIFDRATNRLDGWVRKLEQNHNEKIRLNNSNSEQNGKEKISSAAVTIHAWGRKRFQSTLHWSWSSWNTLFSWQFGIRFSASIWIANEIARELISIGWIWDMPFRMIFIFFAVIVSCVANSPLSLTVDFNFRKN